MNDNTPVKKWECHQYVRIPAEVRDQISERIIKRLKLKPVAFRQALFHYFEMSDDKKQSVSASVFRRSYKILMYPVVRLKTGQIYGLRLAVPTPGLQEINGHHYRKFVVIKVRFKPRKMLLDLTGKKPILEVQDLSGSYWKIQEVSHCYLRFYNYYKKLAKSIQSVRYK